MRPLDAARFHTITLKSTRPSPNIPSVHTLRVYVLGQVVGQADLTGFTFHDSTDLLNVGRLNST